MAERRMFAKSVIETDDFMDMPATAKVLYFYLMSAADDDGFVDKPKGIMRLIGSSQDDMKILLAKQYVICFDTGVLVVRHWKVHNYIRKDLYKPTIHKEVEFLSLEDGAYQLRDESVTEPLLLSDEPVALGKDRLGKDRLGKDNNMGATPPNKQKAKAFTPPTLEEVEAYIKEKGYSVDAKYFFEYYEARDWQQSNGKPVKKWKACVVTWAHSGFNNGSVNNGTTTNTNRKPLPVRRISELEFEELSSIYGRQGS